MKKFSLPMSSLFMKRNLPLSIRTARTTYMLACLFIVLFLVSCVQPDVHSFPSNWAAIQQGPTGGSCPKIEGIYQDQGQYSGGTSGRPCYYETGECKSLIFNLLGDARSTDIWESKYQNAAVEQVSIKQPSPGIIEISAFPGERQQTLSMENGDFSCDSETLLLNDKTAFFFMLVFNGFSTDSRTFYIGADGSLIMKSVWRNSGLLGYVPLSVSYGDWYRWARTNPNKSED